jgi:hypothetical protein
MPIKSTKRANSRNSQFQRGTGCFNCESCGRRTRETQNTPVGMRLCEDCYEIAGIYNVYQDNGNGEELAQYFNEVQWRCTNIIEKGGTLDSDAKQLLQMAVDAQTVVVAAPSDAEFYVSDIAGIK